MLNGRRLIADTFCDVYSLLEPWIDHGFWDFESYTPPAGSICMVGRKQVYEHTDKFKSLCDTDCCVIFANSAEGSSTQIAQLRQLGLEDHVRSGRVLLLTGGRMPSEYVHMIHEHFFVRILAYQENLAAMKHMHMIFDDREKPWKFLFLNGRSRPHRKYLYHRLRELGLLDQALWTMMEGRGSGSAHLSLVRHGREMISDTTPIRSLPPRYEIPRYRKAAAIQPRHDNAYIKFDVFDQEWGEIYLEPAPYVDTYFSLVTETVLEYPYSFFTEKIAKPLAMGHPWVAATNSGFYRDLRALGFQTFAHVIDESFDNIINDTDRMERIITVVQDLCQQDLVAFVKACQDVCKYNQQHLQLVVAAENRDFPGRFFEFVDRHG